jgi:dTDP-4-amino-4,6-dideoxygalactose transaminase
MLNTSLAPWPYYTEEEIDAVAEVLTSNRVNYWTGQQCREFEREFASWTGSQKAIAVSNGTLALDLALQGLSIGAAYGGSPTDEVIVTPRTFIASISCVVSAGAIPVFADVDKDSGLITAETIAAVLTDNTRAIIPVHLAGWPCDMDPILRLAVARNLKVIEDCAQAHGALYRGRPVGSIGDVGAWSFCQDKIMTTGGEGGMITCDDEALWSRMWSFKDHGKSWDAVYNREHAPGFRWLHESFGTNWRMLEIQATIGRIQLRRMKEWNERRTRIALRISEALQNYASGLTIPLPSAEHRHAFYRLYAYVRPDGLKSSWTRDRIVAECVKTGAPVYQGSCSEVYLEKAFERTTWCRRSRLPVARRLGETSLMFLTHPTITDEELERYVAAIITVLKRAVR